jgi:hypothetical protein
LRMTSMEETRALFECPPSILSVRMKVSLSFFSACISLSLLFFHRRIQIRFLLGKINIKLVAI